MTSTMQRAGIFDLVSPFGEYHLTVGEARRAILAYAGAEVIWEWRGHGAQRDFRAGVALNPCVAREATSAVGAGDTPLAALEDLLWRLALPALLAEDADAPVRSLASSALN
jgi:hypothetical protein